MRKFLRAVLSTTFLVSLTIPAAAQNVPAFRVPLEQSGTGGPVGAVYAWVAENSNCSNSCGTGTRTTSYKCQNVTNFDAATGGLGPAEPVAACQAEIGPAPSNTTSTCTNFAGCGFDWVKPPEVVTVHPIGTNPIGRPGCGDVQREYDPTCRRNDGTAMAKGDHGFCSDDLPDYNDVADKVTGALGYDRRGIETNACNTSDHKWDSGAWSAWSSTCSTTAMRTRSVSCTRRFDGSSQPDSACPSPKPASSEVSQQYGSCSYTPVYGQWGAWSSECRANATRSRSYTCQRSNGDTVPNSECSSRGVVTEALTETGPRYGSCTYTRVNVSAWSAYSSTCSATASRTRTYDCRRSDGTVVADSECASRGIELTETQNSAQYGGCSYAAANPSAWSAWANGCSSNTTRTRSFDCRRSDGTIVADSQCSTRGISLTETQSGANYASCSYAAANPSAWGGWASGCSANTTRSRSYQCLRADGTVVANSECTSRGIGLTETQSGANYASCTYTPQVSSTVCSTPGFATQTNSCRRSDGATVDVSFCGIPAQQTVSSQACVQYSWATGDWSSATPCTNGTQLQTRSVTCHANPGGIVPDSACTPTAAKPATSNTQTCTNVPGTGRVIRSGGNGGEAMFCSGSKVFAYTSPAFPQWCKNEGGTWYAEHEVVCEDSRDPYGAPWYSAIEWECRAY